MKLSLSLLAVCAAGKAHTARMQAINGFFAGSGEEDHAMGKYTVEEAIELCGPDKDCLSFTFNADCETEAKQDVWFKKTMKENLSPGEGWCVFAKPRADRKDGISYNFEVGDRIKVTNSYEIIGGPPPKDYIGEKELEWPNDGGKMLKQAGKGLGFTKEWNAQGWGGTVVHIFEQCERSIPPLLAGPDALCYVLKADYSGSGLVPETNLCIIVDAFGKGTLAPLDTSALDCSKQNELCSRYWKKDGKNGGKECVKCFESLGGTSKCPYEIKEGCGVKDEEIEVDVADDEL